MKPILTREERSRGEVVTLLHHALQGTATEEMAQVAEAERVPLERLIREIAAGTVIVPANVHHPGMTARGIGRSLSCKVNANIGNSELMPQPSGEIEKLRMAVHHGADAVMDLSTAGDIPAIRAALIAGCSVPLGTVPVYEAVASVDYVASLEEDDFVGVVRRHAEQGVDFATIHCGLLSDHIPLARKRRTGIVSRGGSLIAEWMMRRGRENPFYTRFDDILDVCRRHDMALSLGDGLRPGCLADASDEAQFAELEILGGLARRAREAEVQVMIEGPGHVPFDQIAMNMLREREICDDAPFYVLGPVVTDIAPGYDHITAAIGATMAAFSGASMICYVTPSEHLGLPSAEEVREGLVASRIAAHAADVALGRPGARDRDDALSKARYEFDWAKVFSLSLDPERARERFDLQGDRFCTHETDYCSMCGPKFCAMRITRLLGGLEPPRGGGPHEG